jgi:hypothetical protein
MVVVAATSLVLYCISQCRTAVGGGGGWMVGGEKQAAVSSSQGGGGTRGGGEGGGGGGRLLKAIGELTLWIGACAASEILLPSIALPALSLTVGVAENLDAFWCTLLVLAGYSLSRVRRLPERERGVPMNRAQTNEWKGWMQVAFVMYHYFATRSLFAPIRVLVSAYVWLTGFGNGVYFWSSKCDFSAARFLQMYWRMNFLVVPLAMATQTDWILYYVVALHTTHFTLVFLSLLLASRACSRRSGDGKAAAVGERVLGIAIFAVLTVAIWEVPGAYEATLGEVFNAGSGGGGGTSFFSAYFWYRTRMDCWSSWSGLLVAAVYPQVLAWFKNNGQQQQQQQPPPPPPPQGRPAVDWRWVAVAALATAVSAGLFSVWASAAYPANPPPGSDPASAYANLHRFVGTLPIPLYLVLRNSPWCIDYVSVPLEQLGTVSLESYLLQFHLLMTRQVRLMARTLTECPLQQQLA